MIDYTRVNHMMNLAQYNSTQSRDPSTKVGAVLQVYGGPMICGHNDFVSLEDPANATREERYADVIHAEEVALLRAGRRARGAMVVTTHEPCGHCWRLLTFAGVKSVAFPKTSDDRRERWGCEGGRAAAIASGVEVIEL